MRIENVRILRIGKASYSGVIFDSDAVDEIIDAFKVRDVFGYFLSDTNVYPHIPSHRVVDPILVDDILYATILVGDTDSGQVLEKFLSTKGIIHARYVPSGFGYIEHNQIKHFKFMGINIVKDNIEVI